MSLVKKFDICINRLKYQKEKSIATIQNKLRYTYGYEDLDLLSTFDEKWKVNEFKLLIQIKDGLNACYFYISDAKAEEVTTRFYKIDNCNSEILHVIKSIPEFRKYKGEYGINDNGLLEQVGGKEAIIIDNYSEMKKVIEKLALKFKDEVTPAGNDIFEKLKSFQDFNRAES